ncbi:hypothetical protein GLAREA_03454 [Glarea lozoyensis ATCC 20868]|uniref:Prolyl 4-hydroxylase alpha subunit domain-containing protein n=1 Tax=Glarea lozoyensis (strain ATCC 20868 / MF5171) TaxID=1116229 RepID=S3CVP6_GLAL2|nr:uncharacterized protein GLAREA_03454 [Glarea lozoyensis ATCC 20868]EPE30487.1 hypothetical protein GLAREA_03454 [Glarea lozoyensis ATCC 20868]
MLQLPPLILTTIFSFLISRTQAQLVGCESTKCPKSNSLDLCPIGNSTLSSIGTLELNTALSRRPLTWTVGFQEIAQSKAENTGKGLCTSKSRRLRTRNEKENYNSIRSRDCEDPESDYLQYRNYYLGTPPNTTDGGIVGQLGCALFFEGISGDLRFPGNSASSDSGTCNDALTRSCVADFTEQVKSKSEKLIASGQTRCVDLQNALQDEAPESCVVAKGGKWGTVYARELNAGPFLNAQSTCKLTMGENYGITLVQSTYNSSSVRTVSGQPATFRDSITPILTVLNPRDNGSTVDINVQCLKPVGTPIVTDSEKKENSGTIGRVTWVSLGGLLVVQVGFWMLGVRVTMMFYKYFSLAFCLASILVLVGANTQAQKNIQEELACSDQPYKVHILSAHTPLIIYIENFVSSSEIDELLRQAEPTYSAATIYTQDKKTGNSSQTVSRSFRESQTAFMEDTPLVECIKKRAAAFQGVPIERLEGLQVVRYPLNSYYNTHVDWIGDHCVDTLCQKSGDRETSFFVYLQADCKGGATEFSKLTLPKGVDEKFWCQFLDCNDEAGDEGSTEKDAEGNGTGVASEGGKTLKFRPKKGNAIFWENLDGFGNGIWKVAHAGMPVIEGEKIGLNIWTRERAPGDYHGTVLQKAAEVVDESEDLSSQIIVDEWEEVFFEEVDNSEEVEPLINDYSN